MPDKLPPDTIPGAQGRALDAIARRHRLDGILRELGPLPPLMRPTRVARLLDLPRQRVYEMIGMDILESVKLGGRSVRVTRESLVRLLEVGCGLD